MTEDYCDLETSKLLREKGFDEKTLSYYEDGILHHGDWFEWNRSPLGQIAAPSQAKARKWLREVHKIDIDIDVYSKHSWCDSTDYCISIFSHGYRIMIEKNEVFDTYEEAEKVSIKYCLENVIK